MSSLFKNSAEAEDALQDGFIKVFQNLKIGMEPDRLQPGFVKL